MPRSNSGMRLLASGLLAAACALAGSGCGNQTGSGIALAGHAHAASRSPQARARAFARQMLARQPVPPRAQRLKGRPPAGLAPAMTIGPAKFSIDLVRLYRVPATRARTLSFIADHRPAGATGFGSGSDQSRHGPVERYVSYLIARTPDGIAEAALVATVLPARTGASATWLRLDAQVIGAPLRTAAEHVNPASYRAVEISTNQTRPGAGPVSRTITAPAVIATLARRLNAMHTAGDLISMCAVATSAGWRLVFEPKSAGAEPITATVTPCNVVAVRAGGRSQPTLADTGDLPALIGRLVQRAVDRSWHRGAPPPVT